VAAYDHLQRLSMPFFESERAGVLVSRLTADVQSLTTFVRQVLVEVVGNMLLLVVTLTILFFLSPILAAVVFISLPILLVSSASYRKRSQPTFLALRDRIADVMTSLQEGLTGVRVVQSFAREHEHEQAYRARSWSLVRAWRAASLVNMRFFPAISLAQAVSTAAVLVTGGYLFWDGKVSIGTVAAVALYLTSLFEPVGRLGDWYSELQSGRAALTKIVDLLETPVSVEPGERALPASGDLVVDAAHFLVRQRSARRRRRLDGDLAGRAPRPRGRDRRGEVDAREAAHTSVRPAGRLGALRRPSTYATRRRRRCASGSSFSRRKGTCSPAPSRKMSGSLGRARRARRWKPLLHGSVRSSDSAGFRRAFTRTSRRGACGCRPASGSSLHSRVRHSSSRR
jgi:ABC-type multidrug transport system fused ATPase/permease subunit